MNKLTTIIKEGQRVLTTQQLAEVYETDVKNIQNNFKRNEERFIEGKHFFRLEGEGLKEFKANLLKDGQLEINKFTKELILWTEKGADRHCKILDTDAAWQQFDNLEETYFRVKESKSPMQLLEMEFAALKEHEKEIKNIKDDVKDIKENSPLFNIECEELQKALRKRGLELLGGKDSKAYKDKHLRTKLYSDIQREIKRQFGLHSYKAVKRKQFNVALEIISNYKMPIILEDEVTLLNNQVKF
jgi:hypothetical protein